MHFRIENLQSQLLDLLRRLDQLQLQMFNFGLHEFDEEFLPVATLPGGEFVPLPAVPGKGLPRLRGQRAVQGAHVLVRFALKHLEFFYESVLFDLGPVLRLFCGLFGQPQEGLFGIGRSAVRHTQLYSTLYNLLSLIITPYNYHITSLSRHTHPSHTREPKSFRSVLTSQHTLSHGFRCFDSGL